MNNMQKVKCPLMDGKDCLYEKCASYYTDSNISRFHDGYKPIPEEEKYIEMEQQGTLMKSIVRKLKPEFREYVDYICYHVCLQVEEKRAYCSVLNTLLKEETVETSLDEFETHTSYPFITLCPISCYNSSRTKETNEDEQ